MRTARYALLTALLVGLVLTLAIGRHATQVSGSLTAYGTGSSANGDRNLFIDAASPGVNLPLLIALIIAGLLVLGGILYYLRRRRA